MAPASSPRVVSMLAELTMCTARQRLKLNPYNQSWLLQLVKAGPSHGPVTGTWPPGVTCKSGA